MEEEAQTAASEDLRLRVDTPRKEWRNQEVLLITARIAGRTGRRPVEGDGCNGVVVYYRSSHVTFSADAKKVDEGRFQATIPMSILKRDGMTLASNFEYWVEASCFERKLKRGTSRDPLVFRLR